MIWSLYDTWSFKVVKKDKNKVQGVDLVTDATAAVVTKATALMTGNLEVKMEIDNDRAKREQNYTRNALGEKVPKTTVKNRSVRLLSCRHRPALEGLTPYGYDDILRV
ncbi:MAG: hypothetical protein PHS46_00030 [Candidatus Omnitrophica bacterium]|nr:hypothetical protein [Candidatus Omnitrophota bacterium]